MPERRNIFLPYKKEIKELLTQIQNAGDDAIIDPSQEYFDPSECTEEYYLSLLAYIQSTNAEDIFRQLEELGDDLIFRRFAHDDSEWEEVEYELDKRYSEDLTLLALFLDWILDLTTTWSLAISPINPSQQKIYKSEDLN